MRWLLSKTWIILVMLVRCLFLGKAIDGSKAGWSMILRPAASLPALFQWTEVWNEYQVRTPSRRVVSAMSFPEEMALKDQRLFYFPRKAHSTEHPSRWYPHRVHISQLSRLKQCGLSVLFKDITYWCSRGLIRRSFYPVRTSNLIIMVIFKCYFSGEHIALSINENNNGVNIALGEEKNRLKSLCMMQINTWNKQTMCQ